MTQRHLLTVAEEGERLDRFLAQRLPGLSRSRLQALIRQERVKVNGLAGKPSLRS